MAAPASSRPRFDWYETDSQIVLNVLVKNMTADKVEVTFAPRTISFRYVNSDSAPLELSLKLNGTISPSESSYRVSSVKAEIKMRKVANFRWNKLEASQEESGDVSLPAAPMASLQTVTAAAPATQTKMRTWDEKIKEVEAEEEKNGGVEELFRRIYSSSSEEVRRAMNKSFQESNGTVLSTNWDEVGTGTVEMKPPESSEWKKYD